MAILFDGTDDCIGIDNVTILDSAGFSNTSYTFTVSCWIKPHGRPAQDEEYGIWEQFDGSSGQGRLGAFLIDNGKIRLRYMNSYRTTSSALIADNSTTWYHIVMTYQFASREIFVNGASEHLHTYNFSSDHSTSGLDFKIGKHYQGNSSSTTPYYFDGEIAEWAAWDSILTSGEVASLYAGASPLMVRGDSLLAYYPLGGPYVTSSTGTTSAYRDIIGGNNLTETSSPSFAATPTSFFPGSSNSGMFYPHMGPVAVVVAASEEEAPSEAALTGSDVIHEIITANDRKQGGICVHSGGTTFAKRDNNIQIAAQNQVTELNNKYVEESRQDHRDEISTDTNNSDGWFGV